MKNVDDLIQNAATLAERGLSKGEIADELNVSRETARWLVERGDAATAGTSAGASRREPDDIHVDWSAVGADSGRLGHVGSALADLLVDANGPAEVTVGIEKAGVPLATAVASDLETDLATYTPRKHQWEEGDIEDLGGSFSRNFADVEGRDCYVIDDTVTSGTTLTETIEAVRERGGNPVACAILADKRGVDEVEGVPVYSLLQVIRV
ncbi:transcriptional regulator GfcR [Halomarina halobia]|uniref:Transcriptional regulator GfcR n=1 Tax=Halomarina halobia TaxID=3033386 RepID=A0ABD6A5P2_9EURY|nr:transcriptional regulator GfcR [Halomarina sp. PSR21]